MEDNIEINVDSDESTVDKTDEENEDPLADIPDEDEPLDGEKSKEKEKPKKSEVVQKIKFREKSKRLERENDQLKKDLDEAKKAAERAPEGSEQERAAKAYITQLAKEVYEGEKARDKENQEKELHRFEDKVDAVLEENSDIPESELIEIIEELEVEPDVAAKIWKRQTTKPSKPKMPAPKRPSNSSTNLEYKKEDRGKSFFQLGRDSIDEARKKGLL